MNAAGSATIVETGLLVLKTICIEPITLARLQSSRLQCSRATKCGTGRNCQSKYFPGPGHLHELLAFLLLGRSIIFSHRLKSKIVAAFLVPVLHHVGVHQASIPCRNQSGCCLPESRPSSLLERLHIIAKRILDQNRRPMKEH